VRHEESCTADIWRFRSPQELPCGAASSLGGGLADPQPWAATVSSGVVMNLVEFHANLPAA
jgi:hypothetical protein